MSDELSWTGSKSKFLRIMTHSNGEGAANLIVVPAFEKKCWIASGVSGENFDDAARLPPISNQRAVGAKHFRGGHQQVGLHVKEGDPQDLRALD